MLDEVLPDTCSHGTKGISSGTQMRSYRAQFAQCVMRLTRFRYLAGQVNSSSKVAGVLRPAVAGPAIL